MRDDRHKWPLALGTERPDLVQKDIGIKIFHSKPPETFFCGETSKLRKKRNTKTKLDPILVFKFN